MFSSAMKALKEMHDKNIAHLDVHAGNLLLDANGNVHLIDFGYAKEIAPYEQEFTSPYYKRIAKLFSYPFQSDICFMGKVFDEDLKLSKYIHFFNGVVCDKAVGDAFLAVLQEMRKLTDFTNENKENCLPIEEIIKATSLLQENVLLKKGVDLLTEPSQQEVTHYLEVLKKNDSSKIITYHPERSLTQKEGMKSKSTSLLQEDFSQASEKNKFKEPMNYPRRFPPGRRAGGF